MYVPAPPSPQAQDLGQRIASTVRTYLAENPGIGFTEVSQAFTVARQLLKPDLGGMSQQTAVVLISVILGMIALGLFVALNLAGGWSPEIPMVVVAIAIAAIGVVAVAISKKGL